MLKHYYALNTTKIWLSSPHMGGNEINYIKQAFSENWIAPLGPNITGFESDLEDYLKDKSKVAVVSSGTAALHLALINCGVSKNDEVICQSLTFTASANPIMYQGAKPVFVDSERDTWNMCPIALEEAIVKRIQKGKRVKAIIVVHLYGMPAKIDEILAVAQRFHIPVIEDAAEALGSRYKGRKCGTFGNFGVLSFNGNKIITTSGGGALVCKEQAFRDRAVFLATQARDEAPHYQHTQIGYNYRMSNITAGIGRGQMEVLDDRVKARRAMHTFYKDLFKNIKGVSLLEEPNADHFSNHWLTAILIDKSIVGFSNEDLRLAFVDNNIEVRPLWKPMHLQPVYKDAPYFGGTVAEDLFKSGLCLPSGSNLTNEDRDRIKEVIEHMFSTAKYNQSIIKKI